MGMPEPHVSLPEPPPDGRAISSATTSRAVAPLGDRDRLGLAIAAFGGAVVLVGSFVEWVHADISIRGTTFLSARFIVGVGAVGLLAVVLVGVMRGKTWRRGLSYVVVTFAFASIALSVWGYAQAYDRAERITTLFGVANVTVDATVSLGVWLALGGSVAWAAGGAVLASGNR